MKKKTGPSHSSAIEASVPVDIDTLESSNGASTAPDGDGATSLEARFLEAKRHLSSSRQRLLNQILEEADETFFLSSREMGNRYNVDAATIVRTIQAMGYQKFAD